MAVEDFGATPEEFDFDAWLAQGSRPQRTVKIYRDWSLMRELTDLEAQIAVADGEDDPSMGDVSAEELREQYQELLERLDGSAMSITVQAITDEEADQILAGIPEKPQKYTDRDGKEKTRLRKDPIEFGDALAAEATVAPKLSRDQVAALRRKLGDGPTDALYQTVTELRQTGKVLPEVPFSPGPSEGGRE